MDINWLQTLSYDEVKNLYKDYLSTLNISQLTKDTALSDAFYLWRNGNRELFWGVVCAEEFKKVSKSQLLMLLSRKSKGNPAALTGGYYSHLKRFREFALGSYSKPISVVREEKRVISYGCANVPKPCKEEVLKYLNQWDGLENYHLQENALNKLFHELCPRNTSIEDVLLKCATLNDFYSTNIFSIYPVAKHIVNLDVDRRLQIGDISLVGDIQKIVIGGKTHNFYSFATKYCSHHNSVDFPIYDSYVERVLFYFQKAHHFSDFKLADLKDYATFKKLLIDFSNYYNLAEFSLKQIDQYIWQLGKEYFPKTYK